MYWCVHLWPVIATIPSSQHVMQPRSSLIAPTDKIICAAHSTLCTLHPLTHPNHYNAPSRHPLCCPRAVDGVALDQLAGCRALAAGLEHIDGTHWEAAFARLQAHMCVCVGGGGETSRGRRGMRGVWGVRGAATYAYAGGGHNHNLHTCNQSCAVVYSVCGVLQAQYVSQLCQCLPICPPGPLSPPP